MKYCLKCGASSDDRAVFCRNCGAGFDPEPPKTFANYLVQKVIAAQPHKSNRPVLIILFAVLAIVGIIIAAAILYLVQPSLPDISYSYLTKEKEFDISYEAVDKIYPSLYSTLDSILKFTATCEGGETDVLVHTEIPGFTQEYEQKILLSDQISQVYVLPPLLTGDIALKSGKEAQIIFYIEDLDTGEKIIQDSIPIHIASVNDFSNWDDALGEVTTDFFLAGLTPESDGILSLKRDAIDWLALNTDSQLEMFQGYQDTGLFGNNIELNTYFQILGLMGAMSDIVGVRYNNAIFSANVDANVQRVMFPDEVLESKSGVCIETALVIASAIQSADMHAMLIFPPGHAQVAVETWYGSGNYYLVETTMLPMTPELIDSTVMYLDQSEWQDYIDNGFNDGNGGCYVLDCDLSGSLGIHSVYN